MKVISNWDILELAMKFEASVPSSIPLGRGQRATTKKAEDKLEDFLLQRKPWEIEIGTEVKANRPGNNHSNAVSSIKMKKKIPAFGLFGAVKSTAFEKEWDDKQDQDDSSITTNKEVSNIYTTHQDIKD